MQLNSTPVIILVSSLVKYSLAAPAPNSSSGIYKSASQVRLDPRDKQSINGSMNSNQTKPITPPTSTNAANALSISNTDNQNQVSVVFWYPITDLRNTEEEIVLRQLGP